MARKRVRTAPAIKTWEEADNALQQIAECGNLIAEAEIELNRRLAEIRAQADAMAKPVLDKAAHLEQQLKDFADTHRSDLEGKSKTLNFGRLGYRLSTTLTIKRDREAEVIRLLRQQGLTDCVIVRESVNRDELKRKSPEVIRGVGAILSQRDEFWYESSREQLQDTKGR